MKWRLKRLRQILKKLGLRTLLWYFTWLFSFLALVIYSFRGRYEFASENIEYETSIASLRTAQEFQDFLSDIESEFNITVACISEKLYEQDSPEMLQDYFVRRTEEVNRSDEDIDYIFYGVINGQFFDGTNWVVDESYSAQDRDWYRTAMKQNGEIVYIPSYEDLRTGNYVVTIAMSLPYDETVIALDVNVNLLQKYAEQNFDRTANKQVIILDDNGTVVIHSDKDEIGKNYAAETDTLGAFVYDLWTRYGEQDEATWFKIDGHNYMLGTAKINDVWSALTIMDTHKDVQELFRFLIFSLLFVIAGSVVIFLIMMYSASKKLRLDDFYENLTTLSKSYMTMHKIDLEMDSFQEIHCRNPKIRDAIGKNTRGASEKMLQIMQRFTAKESLEDVLFFVDLHTLPTRIGSADSLTIEFLGNHLHWMRGRFSVAERGSDGLAKSVIWTVESIEEEKRERERLQYLAETDKLTGIRNRGSGEAKISEYLHTYDGMFLLFDVDKFKSINDTYGHSIGDKVLTAVADCLKASFREDDVVMRLGGDEFVAFARNVKTRAEAQQIINRLFAGIDDIRIPHKEELRVRISAGVTFSRRDNSPTFKEVYKKADEGTYQSKIENGNFVTYVE
ncbi:MAG: sensor domain-containing diguanylate cyclase [Lachnospiraceae bacterium]|nr:sensor domain-containing diguanylate cyclase [Lachnospiraceae bacterium]